ncbi:MAG: hypothetical protein OHK0015_08600 [Chloroflexi bacterium OHK40]
MEIAVQAGDVLADPAELAVLRSLEDAALPSAVAALVTPLQCGRQRGGALCRPTLRGSAALATGDWAAHMGMTSVPAPAPRP